MNKKSEFIILGLVLFCLSACTSKITEYSSDQKKQEDCTGDQCVSVKAGSVAGNIVLPNYTNAFTFFRDLLSLPQSKTDCESKIQNSSFSKSCQIYSSDLQNSKDNLATVTIPNTLTAESVFSYQKYAIAACTDFVHLKSLGKSNIDTGNLKFNLKDDPHLQSSEIWGIYIKSLASMAWGKDEVSSKEYQILENLRLELMNEEKLNLANVAIYLCATILTSPSTLVN